MNFEFISPQKIIFGNGSIAKLGAVLDPYNKPLLLSGNSLKISGRLEKIIDFLNERQIYPLTLTTPRGEPSPSSVDDIAEYADTHGVDCVVSIGGGSVIDTGKAVAGLAVNTKGIENYLEGVGSGMKLTNSPLPFIAVPTTAGSGAEATKNAVISDLNKKYKKSFRDERLVAKLIIIDPELTLDLPENETLYGGMDAICQLVESFTSIKQNDFCKAFSAFFIPKAVDALLKLKDDLHDIELRFMMLKSSLASGIALANSGLGAVHGFASGMGGMFDLPHGLICAILLPHVMKLNCGYDKSVYSELASIMKTDENGLVDFFYEMNGKLGIPENFKGYHINPDLSDEIAMRSQGGSMTGNPVEMTVEKWREFISGLL
jgi:alcohol dehydrogenase class IV